MISADQPIRARRPRPDLYSLIESAKLNRLAPEAYLREVLSRIADHPASRLADLPLDMGTTRSKRQGRLKRSEGHSPCGYP